MNLDKIDYSLSLEVNKYYKEELEYWKESEGWEEDKPKEHYSVFTLLLNGEPVNCFTEPRTLLDYTTQDSCYFNLYWYPNNNWDNEVHYPDNEHKSSRFEPFTCSCGISGCAGIWDGVHLKVRKHTVEWRIKKNMGYTFLDKRFYSFDKKEYFNMLERLKGELNETR